MMKKANFAFISIFILLVVVTSSYAEDWIFVTSTGSGEIGSYVDMESIDLYYKGPSNVKRFNMYHYFKGKKSFRDHPIERLYAASYVECEARTIGYDNVTYEWSFDGRKETHMIPPDSEVKMSKPVKPESVDEAILDFVCNYKKQG